MSYSVDEFAMLRRPRDRVLRILTDMKESISAVRGHPELPVDPIELYKSLVSKEIWELQQHTPLSADVRRFLIMEHKFTMRAVIVADSAKTEWLSVYCPRTVAVPFSYSEAQTLRLSLELRPTNSFYPQIAEWGMQVLAGEKTISAAIETLSDIDSRVHSIGATKEGVVHAVLCSAWPMYRATAVKLGLPPDTGKVISGTLASTVAGRTREYLAGKQRQIEGVDKLLRISTVIDRPKDGNYSWVFYS